MRKNLLLCCALLTVAWSYPSCPKAQSFPKETIQLMQGNSYQVPIQGAKNWKSSNKKIATVSKTGLVKAVGTRKNASGSCTITATYHGQSYKIPCIVYSFQKHKTPYHKNGVHITLYKGKYNECGGKAIYYAAHVKLDRNAYNKMHIAKANGKRSNGFQTIYQMVHKKNNKAYQAILAVNGPFNGKDSKKWNVFGRKKYYTASYHDYHEIFGGVYAKGKIGSYQVGNYGTYSSSTGYLRPGTQQEGVQSGMSLSEAAKKKLISDTLCGDMGGELLYQGKISSPKNNQGIRQRTFIGTNGSAGDFWIVVANGRIKGSRKADKYSNGLNAYGEGMILKRLGCQYGYNLDGGGSSTMIYRGKTINQQTALRTCYDALYIKK